jgi:hypothetical protein
LKRANAGGTNAEARLCGEHTPAPAAYDPCPRHRGHPESAIEPATRHSRAGAAQVAIQALRPRRGAADAGPRRGSEHPPVEPTRSTPR